MDLLGTSLLSILRERFFTSPDRPDRPIDQIQTRQTIHHHSSPAIPTFQPLSLGRRGDLSREREKWDAFTPWRTDLPERLRSGFAERKHGIPAATVLATVVPSVQFRLSFPAQPRRDASPPVSHVRET